MMLMDKMYSCPGVMLKYMPSGATQDLTISVFLEKAMSFLVRRLLKVSIVGLALYVCFNYDLRDISCPS